MMYRLAASPTALVLFILVILVGVAGIITEQVNFLVANSRLNFIPREISLEEDIAILLAAFGVFLEHRFWLLDKIYPESVPDKVHEFDQYSQRFGIFLILIAVFIECFDLLFLALNTWGFDGTGLKYLEVALLFAFNIIAVLSLTKFAFDTMWS